MASPTGTIFRKTESWGQIVTFASVSFLHCYMLLTNFTLAKIERQGEEEFTQILNPESRKHWRHTKLFKDQCCGKGTFVMKEPSTLPDLRKIFGNRWQKHFAPYVTYPINSPDQGSIRTRGN
ncbi:MAG: hypothetical protein R3B91_07055 [Planctomycetaceae bacterium]